MSKLASPNRQDLVLPVAYDDFGRQAIDYLPYAGGATGDYKMNALREQWDFYQKTGDNIANSGYAYSEKIFEPSPLNRVLKTAAPGEAWHIGSGKEVAFDWRGNTVAKDGAVRLWQVDEAAGLPKTTATYAEQQLYVSITTDEHQNQVLEYKDKQGLVVLKKVQLTDTPSPESTTDYLWTYYVYDDFDRLRFVIQPEGVNQIANSTTPWVVSEDLLKKFCFSYAYDGRGRMIKKQVPGAGPVEMVYNKRDLLVLTRDGNQKVKGE